jgi:hypothetical protein
VFMYRVKVTNNYKKAIVKYNLSINIFVAIFGYYDILVLEVIIMKRLKRFIISLILALSLTTFSPEVNTIQVFTPTTIHVQAKTTYVLVTRTGKKYHIKKCGNGTYYKATLKQAKARGLTPCKKCY